MKERDTWGSRLGVILAVAGSAVGLGNFLVFPGRVATNGGGAFLIPYLIAFVLIGIPLAWMEWGLGRFGGRYGHGSGPGILDKIIRKPVAKYIGSLTIFGPLLIFFLYIFIESWLLGYIYYGLTGAVSSAAQANTSGQFFGDYLEMRLMIAGIPASIFFFAVTFAANFAILFFGVRKGIETASKILMPLLLIIGLILMIRTLTLPNISTGLGYLWNPNFKELTNIDVWFAATSQIFFTLSVGIGTILTYASYVKPKQDIALSCLTANATNEFVEVIIGGTIMIPTAIVLLGLAATVDATAKGPFSLGFITMPLIFLKMGALWGYLFQLLWFILLFIGGITSSISILQPGISFLEDELELDRHKAVIALAGITLLFSLLVLFGFGSGIDDELDLWGFQFTLLFMGMIEAIIFAWVVGMDKGMAELTEGASIRIPKIYRWIMQYITPTFLIGLLLLWFTVGGGWGKIMMSGVIEREVIFLGCTTTNIFLMLMTRGMLLALLVAINGAIYYAWHHKGSALKEVRNGH